MDYRGNLNNRKTTGNAKKQTEEIKKHYNQLLQFKII